VSCLLGIVATRVDIFLSLGARSICPFPICHYKQGIVIGETKT
jgi:hypothetical protein